MNDVLRDHALATRSLFYPSASPALLPPGTAEAPRASESFGLGVACKVATGYPGMREGPKRRKRKKRKVNKDVPAVIVEEDPEEDTAISTALDHRTTATTRSDALVAYTPTVKPTPMTETQSLIHRRREHMKKIKPEWHAPWKLMRVISGHTGWVRCVSVDHANQWFATGSADRTIKIWDLASGTLKLTLTGHISAVRGLVISPRHPYLFSVSEDKTVRCWDLEHNKVIRSYHGHLSGVYCAAIHPELDVLMTGGRDCGVRVWDMRSRQQVRVLSGHSHTIADIAVQADDPQVISASHDSMVRTWDLVSGRTMACLTNHKKGVRSLALHPTEFSFCSASADNLKVWKLPEARFLRNMSGHKAIVNSLALNRDNVLVSGGDDGSMRFWDWKTGYCFQDTATVAQPGSLESENGIFAMQFDHTGSRLITAEADKSIKVWKEDAEASEATHPVEYKADRKRRRY